MGAPMGTDIDDINRGYLMAGVVPFTRPEDARRHELSQLVRATQAWVDEAAEYHAAETRAPMGADTDE